MTGPRHVLIAALVVVLAATASPARCQEADGDAKTAAGDKGLKLDLSVPESPAFKALGVTPQEVIRPSSPKDLAGQLLNGVDAHGNLQTGFALDANAYMLVFGNDLSLQQYRRDRVNLARLLARTEESLATTKGSSDDDESVRLAAGFRITPWDEGDPRLDTALTDCIRKHAKGSSATTDALVQKILDLKEKRETGQLTGAESKTVDLEIQTAEADLKKATDAFSDICREEARARNWNKSAWSLGVAPIWLSSSGNVDDLTWDTASVWTSLALGGFENVPGLDHGSQLLVSARYNHDEHVADPEKSDGSFIEQRSLVIALQLRLAAYRPVPDAAPSLILSAEGDYLYADPKHGKHDSSYRGSLGADIKIPRIDNTYIKISAGGAGGSDREDNQGFVSATIRHGS